MIEKHEGRCIFIFNFLECKKNNFGMGVGYSIISNKYTGLSKIKINENIKNENAFM